MDKGVYKRQDRLIKEKRKDVYREWGKMPEPTLCTECGALFLKGRWSWAKPTGETNKAVCPACKRMCGQFSGRPYRDQRRIL